MKRALSWQLLAEEKLHNRCDETLDLLAGLANAGLSLASSTKLKYEAGNGTGLRPSDTRSRRRP